MTPTVVISPTLVQDKGVVRAVVLSDIHATLEPAEDETHVAKSSAELRDGNALTAARAYLSKHFGGEHGGAQLLLCPGDMVHRGDPAPMEWVWQELHGIAADLGAVLIGAVQNHDLVREPERGKEAQETLRSLSPKFPHADNDCRKSYWADAFGVLEGENWRVLSLNSCALHGGFDQGEADFGRLMPRCVQEMKEYFASADTSPPVNICMVHHHPQEWSHGGERETKHLLGGDQLIDLLDSRPERWMLLHGHKHYPALGYFGHSTHGPVRLAAASVGINLMSDTGVEVRNQMHVIDFDLGARELGLPMAGEIRSSTWDGGGAWSEANAGAVFPRSRASATGATGPSSHTSCENALRSVGSSSGAGSRSSPSSTRGCAISRPLTETPCYRASRTSAAASPTTRTASSR